jgi:hypothetical protein
MRKGCEDRHMKIETKSILAKLLATENISVEQQNIPTAAFNPTTRTLYIPNWKDMSNSLQDLLIGHEVGHAWDTPAEGWHDAVCEDPTLKGFLNVIEDARIERKIKSRYPGLVKSFYAGYRELFERDFFGVKDVDVNTLPLIDRINLHFKVGAFLNVQFSDTDNAFVARCATTETWEDVEALAREIHGKAKEEAEQNIEDILEQFEDMSSTSDEDEESFGEGEGEQTDSEDDSELDSGFSGGERDEFDELFGEDEEEVEDTLPAPVQEFVETGGVGSITDKVFREKETQLVDNETKKDAVYVSIPTNIDPSKYIKPAASMYKFQNFTSYSRKSVETHATLQYKDFIAKNSKTVNQMVSNFEMKRKAALFIKAKTAKTGDLDDKRLWSYKTSDNLFKQITTIPEGKNHGMIMYLDMSGSMYRNMAGTIEQLINLSMFARKVNIPFEVYGFTDTGHSRYHVSAPIGVKAGDYYLENVSLTHLLSSSFTKKQAEMAYKCLLLWRDTFNRRGKTYHRSDISTDMFQLGSTPLNATLVIGMEIAKQFRKANRVEVLNTIILTDGDATDSATHWVEVFDSDDKTVLRESSNYSQPPATFKYGSSVTPMYNAYHCHRNTKITATLIDLYKEVTGSKVINFHLLSSWNLRELSECKGLFSINHQGDVYDDWDKVVKTRSTGLVEVKDTVGFDVRYLMNGSDLTIQDSQLEVKSNTKGDLLRGFKKFAGNKTQNRLFVQKFTDQVA